MDQLHVFPTVAELTEAVCNQIARASCQAKAESRRFSLALSGGSTPRTLHQTMTSTAHSKTICWEAIDFLFGDERMVPPDHNDSNFRMAQETLFSLAPIPPDNIHRMQGELSPADAAANYQRELNAVLTAGNDGFPNIDLVLLGLGPDGHIASLFPGTQILEEQKKWVSAVFVEKFNSWRLSLTYPIINRARKIFVLVTGESKADIVATLFTDARAAAQLPAKRLAPAGELHWYLDAAAAKNLSGIA